MSKFKVGDKVRILNVEAIGCGSDYWKNGDVVEVVRLDSDGSPRPSRFKGDTAGLCILERELHAIERVEAPSNAQTFEIGGQQVELTPEQLAEAARKLQSAADRARKKTPVEAARRATVGDIIVITSGDSESVNKVGDIGKIVTDVHDSMPYRVEVPGREERSNWEYERCVRLATAEEIAKYEEALKPKLKVGDWARAKVSAQDITEGKAYKVESISVKGFPWIRDDAGDHNRLEIGNFEIIAEPTPFDRAGRKPGEFKVGDIVRVTNRGFEEINEGDIGEITGADGSRSPLVRVGNYAYYVFCELVTPVESRVDRAEGADVA